MCTNHVASERPTFYDILVKIDQFEQTQALFVHTTKPERPTDLLEENKKEVWDETKGL